MIDVVNVSKIFGEGTVRVEALKSISMHVEDSDFLAVTGPSGSGKSTLLNVIGGLDRVTTGEVLLDGVRIDNLEENALVDIRRKKIAYIFQQYHLIPSLTSMENVLLPLTLRGHRNEDEEHALLTLEKVGMVKRAKHKPGQMSGGEQQRVAIARALVNNCSLILADEPTGNVDQETGAGILNLFEQLNGEGNTIIVITHSAEVANRAMRKITLRDGEIVI